MKDYHNLFECSCGKFLPFGTKRCPHCGYDYTNIDKSEKKFLFEKFYMGFCFVFPFVALSFFKPSAFECIGELTVIFLPFLLYFTFIWYNDSKEFSKYRKTIYEILDREVEKENN